MDIFILGPQQIQLALVRLRFEHGLVAVCRDMLADDAQVIRGVGDAPGLSRLDPRRSHRGHFRRGNPPSKNVPRGYRRSIEIDSHPCAQRPRRKRPQRDRPSAIHPEKATNIRTYLYSWNTKECPLAGYDIPLCPAMQPKAALPRVVESK